MVEPRKLEHSLNKREVGGSSPSPATNKKFKRFELRWAEPIGRPECPYLKRWVLVINGYSIRIHHWLASDDLRHQHDHAWDYIAFIFRGFYLEHVDGDVLVRKPGSITHYKAEHSHMVEINPSVGCWSLLITGRPRRDWGFYVPGREKLMRPLRYFSRYGHHECE